jgi:hypothetical protein
VGKQYDPTGTPNGNSNHRLSVTNRSAANCAAPYTTADCLTTNFCSQHECRIMVCRRLHEGEVIGMSSRSILCAFLLAVIQPVTFGATIFFDKKAETVEDKVVIIAPHEFDAWTISRMSKEFLHSSSGKRLARLTIGTSQEAVTRALFKMTGHPSLCEYN